MRLLIIEDDQSTSSLLAATLSAHHYVVDVIDDGAAGLELAIQWDYDLILLDILLPSLNGVEVCRQLRDRGCRTPILILTSQDSNQAVIAGLDAGADDYVGKSCEHSQLLARVRALLRRSSPSSTPVLTWGALCLDPALAQVTYSGRPVALRPKEYNLLELFLRCPQRIHSRSSIIDHLWAMDEPPVEGSVTNLIKDLRQRLKAAGMETNLIETVYGLGYRLKSAPPTRILPPQRPSQASVPNSTPLPSGLLQQPANLATTNLASTNLATIDLASTNLATTDLIATDLIATDLTTNNLATADLAVTNLASTNLATADLAAIQQIGQRFRKSLNQRITTLETAVQTLQSDSSQQREAIREAHKLAGGLGTFGYGRAARTAQRIEHLLETGPVPASQLSPLLQQLRRQLGLADRVGVGG